MFVYITKIVQSIQRAFYPNLMHTYKMHKIDGKLCILQSVFIQKKDMMIDLQHPLLRELNVRFVEISPDGKYNEFYAIREIEK